MPGSALQGDTEPMLAGLMTRQFPTVPQGQGWQEGREGHGGGHQQETGG